MTTLIRYEAEIDQSRASHRRIQRSVRNASQFLARIVAPRVSTPARVLDEVAARRSSIRIQLVLPCARI